jgi:hypothetical protein
MSGTTQLRRQGRPEGLPEDYQSLWGVKVWHQVQSPDRTRGSCTVQ